MKHQHRESSFRRYETLIAQALTAYPELFIATKEAYGLPPSIETGCARVRDAMNSLIANNWATHIDTAKLRTIKSDFTVAIRNDSLIFGSKQNVRATSEFAVLSEKEKAARAIRASVQSAPIACHDLTPAETVGVIKIALLGGLRHPIETKLAKDAASALESTYQHPIQEQPDGSFWILP